MANGFSPQMYSEGNVVFDSTPSIRMAEQLMNRQLAKEEALDKYFGDLNKSFNPAGMRTQDTPFFMQKTNELRDFYSKNKNAIRNPKNDLGKAQNEYYSRYQDILNTVNQSKQEGEKIKGIATILSDPDKRARIPESIFDEMSLHDLPLNDPRRKSFNIERLVFDPKPFGIKEQQSFIKGAQEGVKMIPQVSIGKTDPRTFQQPVVTTETLDPEGKSIIGQRAAGAYNSDPSFKKYIEDLSKDVVQTSALNKAFKTDFGREIESPEDLAAAWTLQNIQKQRRTEKLQTDWRAQQDYRHKQAIDLMNRRPKKGDNEGEYDSWLEQVWSNLYDPTQESGEGIERITPPASIPLDPVTAKALSRNGIEPDAIIGLPDKKVRPIFYERDKDKQIVVDEQGEPVVNDILSTPLSKQQWKIAMGGKVMTKKDLSTEMKNTKTSDKSNDKKYPLPAGKPRVVKQGGYTYIYNEQTGKYE